MLPQMMPLPWLGIFFSLFFVFILFYLYLSLFIFTGTFSILKVKATTSTLTW